MKNELQDYVGRPLRYANIDGTGEISMGVMFLGFGLLGYLQAALPESSMWRNGFASILFIYLILIPVWALGIWGWKAIKEHITWPRTGYVAHRPDGKSWWTGVVISLILSQVFAAGFTYPTLFAWRHDSISLPRMGTVGF